MRKLGFTSLLLAFATLPAPAQSINIDLAPAGSPFGVPHPAYGGPANSPGVWNRVGSISASNLQRWDGQTTSVGFSTTGVTAGCAPLFWNFDHANTSGDDEALLDDGHCCEELSSTYDFTNLGPGDYTVDTILLGSGCTAAVVGVTVTGSSTPIQYVSPGWSGAYVQGSSPCCPIGNYTEHQVTVSNGTLQIRVDWVSTIVDFIHVVGIQLDKHEDKFIGTMMCYGDGTARDCPCANNGEPGFGCQNSAGTGGAFLFASGTTSPDTVVLHGSGELPSSLTVVIQGDAMLAAHLFGDGLRCVGGVLKRLYTKSASGGNVAVPGLGDPSITARSAALGNPIPPGERRYYQLYYRDPNPAFCPVPTGSTFNATNAVKIVW